MDKNLISEQTVLLNVELSNQEELFNLIANEATKLNFIQENHHQDVVNAFKNRELEGSTGFENGFAIPHAQSEFILEPAIFIVRLKTTIAWETFDNQAVKIAIGLLVPTSKRATEHLTMLSQISLKLMDEDFQKSLKELQSSRQIVDIINF